MTESTEKQPESATLRAFVVQTEFASPNRIDNSEEVTEMRRAIDYTYPKLTRNKIGAIREYYMKQIRSCTVDFPPHHKAPLRLCNESQKNDIRALVKLADEEFQKIDKILHAEVLFLELNIHDVQRGELYGQVIAAIRYRIISEVIEKIGEKVGQLPEKSQKAMLNLIDRMKTINILGDKEVDDQLESIREKIMTQDIATVKSELFADLSFTKQRMAYVNL
jgi:hypothetical protein